MSLDAPRTAAQSPEPAADAPSAPAVVSVRRPVRLLAPLVFASPHSGRGYDPAFLAQSALSLIQLRRSEDAYVDELIASAPAHGAPLLTALFPRVYLDPNRAEDELDPALIDGGLPEGVEPSQRAAAGLGVAPRLGAEGRAIHRARLKLSEVRARIAECHAPYHAALEAEMRAAEAVFGCALLVDCHSMPSSGARGFDMVIGDRHGTSCAPAVTAEVETALRAAGFRTIRNTPYAGGYATQRHGRPQARRHAVQIEINRGLYLDEGRVTRSGTFAQTRARLDGVIAALVKADWLAILA